MRRALKWIAVLVALAAAAAAAWWFTRPVPPSLPVVRVQRSTYTDTVPGTATGVVEPARRIQVQAQLSARITDVKVHRGDVVKAGDPLVVLDPSDIDDQVRTLQAALPVLETRVQQAEARAGQVGRDAERAERLAADGSLAPAQLDSATSGRRLAALDAEVARAALRQARVQLDVMRAALRHAMVRAPFDGIVLDVDAVVGQMASALSLGSGGSGSSRSMGGMAGASAALLAGAGGGSGGLVDLADESTMAVDVDVDERDFGRVQIGQEATLSVDALGKKAFTGTVEEVFPFISRALDQNRTARVRVRLPDGARAEVRPGMSVQVDVVVARRDNVLVVPTTAILTRSGGKAVWRVIDGRIHETPVKVSASTWESAVIESGLDEGDVVLMPRSGSALKDGMKIRIEEVAKP